MRILLLHDSPFDRGVAGQQARALMQGLLAAGHQVRALLGDDSTAQHRQQQSFDPHVHRVTFGAPAAELPQTLPYLDAARPAESVFFAMTDQQIAEYRAAFRRHLDQEVTTFDPHLIHVQHLWLQGELALETGVPYVVAAFAEDFVAYDAQPRCQSWADQAAENAGRIFADQPALRAILLERYPHVPHDRVADSSLAEFAADPTTLLTVYEQVLIERLGRLPDQADGSSPTPSP